MPVTRKPKKVFVQFAVAAFVAIVVAVIAIGGGLSLVTTVMGQAQQSQKDLQKEKEKLEAEKQRLLDEQQNLQKTPKTYKVVQALVNLLPGQPITQDMVTLVSTEDLPSTGTLSMLSEAVGKVVKAPIMSGEPVDSSKLLDSGSYLIVQPGKRAITILVDAVGGLNGALIPGSHVDILTTVKNETSPITRTLLQNIPVLSVGGATLDGKTSSAASQQNGIPVTVVVTPQQAELLTLANLAGTFHLTLRNYNDSTVPKMTGADLTVLMTDVPMGGLGKALPANPRMPLSPNDGFHNVNFSPDASNLPAPDAGGPSGSKFSMQIYRGAGSETVDFQQ